MSSARGPEAEARRLARANAEVRVFGPDDGEAEADADALWWDRIPVDERVELVWQLSVELYGLAEANGANDTGLPRPSARAERR